VAGAGGGGREERGGEGKGRRGRVLVGAIFGGGGKIWKWRRRRGGRQQQRSKGEGRPGERSRGERGSVPFADLVPLGDGVASPLASATPVPFRCWFWLVDSLRAPTGLPVCVCLSPAPLSALLLREPSKVASTEKRVFMLCVNVTDFIFFSIKKP